MEFFQKINHNRVEFKERENEGFPDSDFRRRRYSWIGIHRQCIWTAQSEAILVTIELLILYEMPLLFAVLTIC
jgi:hypothetical protein